MKLNSHKIVLLMLLSIPALAQNKGIGDEEITITKERSVKLQKANRVFEKIPTEEKTTTKRKMAYTFFEKKPVGIEEVEFSPNIVSPVDENKKGKTQSSGYPNYFKVGGGNFGRFYAETFINSDQSQNLVFGVHGLHNAAKRGPIDGENSGNSLSKIAVDGKYNSNGFELKGNLGYEFRKYYFFGYDTTSREYDKEDIKQTLNILNFGVTLQNTNANPIIDYSIKTNLRNLKDNLDATELEWGTQFNATFPIIENTVTAMIEGEAYLTNRSDAIGGSEVKKRNLFRIAPSFNLDFNQFNAKLGFKAVNEYDQVTEINQTKGFPTVTLTYKTPGLFYFFAGYDGDIIRNTLGSMLDENPWLKPAVSILNTTKDQEYFIGSRGDLFSGLNYNFKASYGKFTGLYYFNIYDMQTNYLRKYDIGYDETQTDFVNVSAEFNYQPKEFWRTNLTADYWYYEKGAFDKPYHRPSFEGRLGNTFVISEKIVSNIDFYYIGSTYARDPFIADFLDQDVKLPAITDLNAEFTYLFSEQFAFFVKLNNIIGKNYQRFYNYPQQGLNFLVGINVSL
ncbi:TonB-dependent receptor [Arcticibacterium luteifluviistationis]|nr:TonB-dependent receptor [Arcticibacterium luteifluviistationis]